MASFPKHESVSLTKPLTDEPCLLCNEPLNGPSQFYKELATQPEGPKSSLFVDVEMHGANGNPLKFNPNLLGDRVGQNRGTFLTSGNEPSSDYVKAFFTMTFPTTQVPMPGKFPFSLMLTRDEFGRVYDDLVVIRDVTQDVISGPNDPEEDSLKVIKRTSERVNVISTFYFEQDGTFRNGRKSNLIPQFRMNNISDMLSRVIIEVNPTSPQEHFRSLFSVDPDSTGDKQIQLVDGQSNLTHITVFNNAGSKNVALRRDNKNHQPAEPVFNELEDLRLDKWTQGLFVAYNRNTRTQGFELFHMDCFSLMDRVNRKSVRDRSPLVFEDLYRVLPL